MYNNLMSHTQLIRGLALTALLIPTMAGAYTSPEEVLSSDQNIGFYNPPPKPRDAEAIQARQQAEANARRDAEQQKLLAEGASSEAPVEDDSLHGAAASSAAPVVVQSGLTTEEQRILDRVKAQQAEADIQTRVNAVLASQQSLHSGAPLSDTGPGSILIGFLLAGAGIWTLWKAKRLEMRSR